MLARKVQMYGNDSLGVTLPKQYLRALGVKKGDVVGIEILSDGSLRIQLQDNQNGAGAYPGAGSPESDAPAATQEASS